MTRLKRGSARSAVKSAAVLALLTLVAVPDFASAESSTQRTGGGTTQTTITVQSRKFAVSVPPVVSAGLVTVRYVQNGGIWGSASLAMLKPGATTAAVTRAVLHGNQGYFDQLALSMGGISGHPSETLTVNLAAGTYVIYDQEQGAKGASLVATKFFTVSPSIFGMRAGPLPRASTTVTMVDFRFHQPGTVPRGMQTIRVQNQGKQNHMWALFKLNPGKTYADLLKFLRSQHGPQSGPPSGPPSSPPPGRPAGGVTDVSPGVTVWLSLPFEPSNYIALCFDRDPKTNAPHFALGMHIGFTVE